MSESETPIEFGDDRLDPTQRAIRTAAFLQILDTGRPAAIKAIVPVTQLAEPLVTDVLKAFAEWGMAQIDDGRVLGIAGLSVRTTQHTIALPQGERWTWCALDAVGIVGATGSGTIISKTPNAGDVSLKLENGVFRPEGMAIFIADGYGMTSSVAQWCPLVDFFPNAAAADVWGSRNGVAGRGVPVAHLAAPAADRWRAIIEGS